MKRTVLMLSALFTLLTGCSGSGPYSQKDGKWLFEKEAVPVPAGESLTPLNNRFAKSKTAAFYRSTAIAGADAGSFEALTENYAKDRSHVWYADTYRKGQEYYAIVHARVTELTGADPATFVSLDSSDGSLARGYAKDKARVWFEGQQFTADAASFTVLEYGFAKDAVSGYYMRQAIPGSDGPTFAGIDSAWSKDARHVWWSDVDLGSTPPGALVTRMAEGADPATFQALENGYGKDAKHVYFQGNVVEGADPATFQVFDTATGEGDARDKARAYREGKPAA